MLDRDFLMSLICVVLLASAFIGCDYFAKNKPTEQVSPLIYKVSEAYLDSFVNENKDNIDKLESDHIIWNQRRMTYTIYLKHPKE